MAEPRIWERAGPPTAIVIYPDPVRGTWRHAVYHAKGAITDGKLKVGASDSPEAAKAEAEAMVRQVCSQYHHLSVEVHWGPPDEKGWIAGDIVIVA